MCGIAGVMTRSRMNEPLSTLAGRMARTLAHRGPDDECTWSDEDAGIGLGFRRLAILDLSEQGRQPMSSRHGRYVIVFNGEVYNFQELRKQFEREGMTFRGASDTEVVLAAFERWGVEAAVDRFVGMFAMAVWDTAERRLWLIRDRLGIKPLFVYAHGGMVAFASEIKALMALPGVDRTVDRQAAAEFLQRLYIPAPRSIFSHVTKLLPGHFLHISDPSAPLPEPRPYWNLAEHAAAGLRRPFAGDEQSATDELEGLLMDAVRLRLRSDVPLGALLSGGIDSSLIVALMQRSLSRPVRTFSIAFDSPTHNEAAHAARVAAHIGTDHTELMVSGRDAIELVPRLPELYDEPHADTAQIPAHLICRLARQDVVVALSGDGGDEVFGGYNRYVYGSAVVERLNRIPAGGRRLLALGLGMMSPAAWERSHSALRPLLPGPLQQRLIGEKVVKLQRMVSAPGSAAMYDSLVSIWPDPRVVLERSSDAQPHRGAAAAVPGMLAQMMLADQLSYLPDDQLAKVDRASMAAGLELRVPLLDHRVVEFSWRLPHQFKVRGGSGKRILKNLAYRHVPQHLLDRPKTGFTVPLNDWLRGPLREWAETMLASARLADAGLLRPAPIRTRWNRLMQGQAEPALDLWAVLMLQAWAERWL